MSDLDVLRAVINTLNQISVPVQYTEQIGIPLYNSTEALKQLLNSINQAVQKKKEEEKSALEPESPQDAEEIKMEEIAQ